MRVAVLFSGGKDSTYATYLAKKQGDEIKYLVTIIPEREDSWMFHFPCISLTKLQAKALGTKQIIQKTKGEKEKELEDLKRVLEKIKGEIDAVVSGAVASNYQKSRIDKVCEDLKLKHLAPLWQKDQEEVLKEEVKAGFEIMITGVFAEGFDESWLGRRIDEEAVKEILELKEKFGISVSGDGGEYESLVLNCPLFNKRIEILSFKKIWDEKLKSGYIVVRKAKLREKSKTDGLNV
ncbi:MAG: TIGR00289 family protein [Candidatus Aenigmatarchaeota archaeon]